MTSVSGLSDAVDLSERADEEPSDRRGYVWYRDWRLWAAVLGTLLVKAAVILLWVTKWRDAGWWGHVNVDLWTWRDFFKNAQDNRIPYVDMHREYPVLASFIYWGLAHFMDLKSDTSMMLVHSSCMMVVDTVNAGLFYGLARAANPRYALP